MKEIFEQYAQYNKWANDKIIDAVLELPAELTDKAVVSSFRSVRLTILHLAEVEKIWWKRIKLIENVSISESDKELSINEICLHLKQQSAQWLEWIMNMKEINFEHVFAYRNSKKEEFKQPVYQVLLQLFNHQTYHRGQIVTLLRQLGVEKIPNTDFISWSRGKK